MLRVTARLVGGALLGALVVVMASGCEPEGPEPIPFVPVENGGEGDVGGEDRDVGDGGGDSGDVGDPGEGMILVDGFPFPVRCVESVGGEATILYEIQAATTSYMIVPFTAVGQTYDPMWITTPSGYVIDLHDENDFQLYGLEYPEIAWINPMVFPPAPNYAHQLEAGLHSFLVRTTAPRICFYVLEDQGPSDTLDLNFYFVGLDGLGLNAASAPAHGDFQEVLAATEEIFAQVGISLGTVRYLDPPAHIAEAYSTIRDYDDLYELLATSEYPGETLGESLSLNVYLTARFTDGSVGVAMGIPGVVGMHASLVAGIGITAEYMGIDEDHNQFTANVIAHEIGHFLGLFHTTEIGGGEYDNLDDTPECRQFNAAHGCPDAQNLMFPYADFDTVELTGDQAFVLRANPLVR